MRTEIGKIGKALQILQPEDTNLQQQTGKIVRNFAMIGLAMCALVVIVFGLTRGDWLHGFLAGITLAMATLPEEFPVVLTIFLALGAWRISQRHVLTRRVPAVEMLGAATVLCTDKTGTLTQNRMTVTHLMVGGELLEVDVQQRSIPEAFHELVEFGILATPVDPFDPMEKAIKEVGRAHPGQHRAPARRLEPDARVPAFRKTAGNVACLALHQPARFCDCGQGRTGGDCRFVPFRRRADGCACAGKSTAWLTRACACSVWRRRNLPRWICLPNSMISSLSSLGLLGLADPIRPEVPGAVKECYDAGIRVIMITGDYPGTARNIARQIGLKPLDDIITGAELDAMSDDELRERIKTTCIFARAVPEQKLRIVGALKANGEVVAMTGDGVNDAPALKAAHIGIAMGGRGTDVARESAALVLVDDNFASIVAAVRMGRRIFDNLKKAMAFIFSVHIPIAGMSLIPVLLNWPLALLPVHVLFLELIIDPACTVVFEMEDDEPDIMQRPPRKLEAPLFGRSMVLSGLIQGLGILAVVAAVYTFGLLAWAGRR